MLSTERIKSLNNLCSEYLQDPDRQKVLLKYIALEIVDAYKSKELTITKVKEEVNKN